MKKRGQITIFIIIAVVVIVAIVFLVITGLGVKKYSSYKDVKDYIYSCMENSLNSGLRFVCFQGGYYQVPEKSMDFYFTKVPYYFYLGSENIPDKLVIEREISKYMQDNVKECVKNISDFEKDYKFQFGEPKIEVSLGSEISMRMDYPITITKGEYSEILKKFNYNQKVDFNTVYFIISAFSAEQKKDPNFVPIGYLSLLAKENNFKFDLTYKNQSEVVYSFIFNDFFDLNASLVYNFAGKYKWEERHSENIMTIEPIPYQRIYAGKEFYYKVKTNNAGVLFDDYTELFNINRDTGEIKFTPSNNQSGMYEIMIKAYDNLGNSDFTTMEIEIEEVIQGVLQ